MRRTRIMLVLALAIGAPLSVYWAVRAQEGRPLFLPPPVLIDKTQPPVLIDESLPPAPKPVDPKFTKQTQPLKKAKGEPPPLLPLPAPERPMADIVPAGAPLFPPPLPAKSKKGDAEVPPPAPEAEPRSLPMPTLDPTKALIVDPPAKEMSRPALPPIDAPIVAPALTAQPAEPDTRVKSFKPIRSGQVAPPSPPIEAPPSPAAQTLPPPPGAASQIVPPAIEPKIVPPPAAAPAANALVGVQAPSVAVEKRGASTLRTGDGQIYYLVVRNLGPGAAQQIRIEEELPANVRMLYADPIPVIDGRRAIWTLSNLPAGAEQSLKYQLQTAAQIELTARVSVQVQAAHQSAVNTTVLRTRGDVAPIAVQVAAPASVAVGKPAVFEIRVANQSQLPLTGVVLFGKLPDGVHHEASQEIKGEVEAAIAPGESRTLRMPTTAVKPGRWTVNVKVTANGGFDTVAHADFEVAAPETLQLQQAPSTRMFVGRNGDLRIDVANNTNQPMRNVQVFNRLPEGIDFVIASERGLYQANSRTVYWLLDLPPGMSKALIVRVHGTKAGPHENVVQARADGMGEMKSVGIIQLEGAADLTLRASGRDSLIEVGRETIYEIQIANPGSVSASNVQLQVQFPPGLTPKTAEGASRCTVDRQSVTIEAIPALAPQGQAVYRVSAIAQPTTERDQRVRVAVVSDQVRVPIQREISTLVVPR